jgi:hypothetical protein
LKLYERKKGHTVPAIETLEKMTRAIGVPLYDGEKPRGILRTSTMAVGAVLDGMHPRSAGFADC